MSGRLGGGEDLSSEEFAAALMDHGHGLSPAQKAAAGLPGAAAATALDLGAANLFVYVPPGSAQVLVRSSLSKRAAAGILRGIADQWDPPTAGGDPR